MSGVSREAPGGVTTHKRIDDPQQRSLGYRVDTPGRTNRSTPPDKHPLPRRDRHRRMCVV